MPCVSCIATPNPDHEARVREIIKSVHPDAFVCLSHEVLRKYREYERTSTTCANAYVSPKVNTYVQDLQDYATQGGFTGSLLMMQSSGGVMAPQTAKAKPINMVESGPAAGAVGCAGLSAALGHDRLISFDMGGTTAKTALIEDGMPKVTSEYYAGGTKGHPLMVETIDLIEVGAGRREYRLGRCRRTPEGWTPKRGRRSGTCLLRQRRGGHGYRCGRCHGTNRSRLFPGWRDPVGRRAQ